MGHPPVCAHAAIHVGAAFGVVAGGASRRGAHAGEERGVADDGGHGQLQVFVVLLDAAVAVVAVAVATAAALAAQHKQQQQ